MQKRTGVDVRAAERGSWLMEAMIDQFIIDKKRK
jgi:hypothetical protein